MKIAIEIAFLFILIYTMGIVIKTQINPDMYFAEMYHKIQVINRKIKKLQFINEVTVHNTNLTLKKYTKYIKELFQKGKYNEKGYQFLMQEVASIANYINNKLKEQNAIMNRNTK